jgi:GNAT superfamily N-acetyltransferase
VPVSSLSHLAFTTHKRYKIQITEANMTLKLRELKPDELATIYPLIRELNPSMKPARFNQLLRAIIPSGYRCIGAFEQGTLIGISGFTIGHRFWCGKQCDIDNFIVTASHRGKGIGERILHWIERIAAKEKCDIIVLDAYAHNTASHKFYHREGYIIRGYHFTKDLT